MHGRFPPWKYAAAGLLVVGIPVAVLVVLSKFVRDGDRAAGANALTADPHAIVRGVYMLGKLSPGAAYAVDTADGLVLIDSGIEASADSVKRQLADLGLDVGRLKAILLTHVHADHSLGAAKLREITGAKIYAGRGDCVPLRAGEPREAFLSTFQMPNVFPHSTTVDVELAGDEVVEQRDARFVAVAAPGHTPGSICYLMEREGLRALFTGDAVQSLTLANKDALGTYAAYLPPIYRGNAGNYLATLRKLREIPKPDLILPGHPAMDAPPSSPLVPLEQWHALLDRGIGAMETLDARYRADGASFLDGTPKSLLTGLHYLGDLDGKAVYCLDAPKGVVVFDAPGGPKLVDFLNDALKKIGLDGRPRLAVVLTSTGVDAMSGLAPLVRATKCIVVAPMAGLDTVRTRCPAGSVVISADDALARLGLDVSAMPLGGRGTAPVAYLLM